jgi:TrmH family RNA methyltransferase
MFPLARLRELAPRTRMRKIARILQGIEMDLVGGRAPDAEYLADLLQLLLDQGPADARPAARTLAAEISSEAASAGVLRGLNTIRHDLLRALHAEPAEWDLVSPDTGLLDRSGVGILPITVYLEDIRSPFNVGSMFRTAEAFGAERILLSPRTPSPDHPRAEKTAKGASHALPWEVAELSVLHGNPDVFALEVGGTPLGDFAFPPCGTVLVGSEELGLSPEALEIADAGRGRVSVPLAGAKRSLNVSVALGILMQAWHAACVRGRPSD